MRRFLLLAAPTVLLLALSAPADARVVVNRSIAGISPGMTPRQVRARLGRPGRVNRDGRAIIGYHYDAPRLKLFVSFALRTHRADAVGTSSGRQRTGKGIGVGSRSRTVRRAYRVACTRYSCTTRPTRSGTTTSFNFSNGRVSGIGLGNSRFD